MTQLLQKSVGQRMTKQISFTCQPVTAAEALRIGLVNEVVPPDRLILRAKEIAARINSSTPEVGEWHRGDKKMRIQGFVV